MNQNYFHTNSCLYQLSSAFILDLWAARIIKTFSYKLLSILAAHSSVFISSNESQNNYHTNSCLYIYQPSSAFILDLWTTRRVKHCYIVSYKLLSSNSYHHYFIHLHTLTALLWSNTSNKLLKLANEGLLRCKLKDVVASIYHAPTSKIVTPQTIVVASWNSTLCSKLN